MKFYIFSFLCHLLLLFIFYKAPVKEIKMDSKNVVVYLTDKKNDIPAPAPAPIQSLNREPIKEIKKLKKRKLKKKRLKNQKRR